jgi:signal transduction histidine kinase
MPTNPNKNKFFTDTHDYVMIVRTLVESFLFIIFIFVEPYVSWLRNIKNVDGFKLGVSSALLFSVIVLLVSYYRKKKNLDLKVLTHWESIGDAFLTIWLIFIMGGTQGPLFFFYFLILMEAAFTFSLFTIAFVAFIGVIGVLGETIYLSITMDQTTNAQYFFLLLMRIVAIFLISYYAYSFAKSFIRERKALEALKQTSWELQEQKHRLELAYIDLKQLDTAKNEFISLASHQLRTPISVIRGFASMLIGGEFGPLNDDQKKYADKINHNVLHLNNIVNDIFNASLIETQKLALNKEPTNLIAVINDAINQLKPAAEHKGLEFEWEIDPQYDNKLINIDPKKMFEVFYNLIDNAIKYTPIGEINMALKNFSDHYLVLIKDSGIGMPENQKNYIFQRFSRLDNAKRIRPDGTGIGLYLVKNIVESHGDQIWFESKLSQGTTFFVKIYKEHKKMGNTGTNTL